MKAEHFDADYYRKFYGNRHTRVSDLRTVRRLARFVGGYLSMLQIPVHSILDIGCGLGHWRKVAPDLWPKARYHGVEYSEYLCDKHGWTRGSIVDFDPKAICRSGVFDLVVCQGVLQYLDDRQAARAIQNLGEWCHGALYLEALTRRDWEEHCDRERTDGDVHLRSGSWYRRRLDRHFLHAGGGVFVSRSAGITMFELETT